VFWLLHGIVKDMESFEAQALQFTRQEFLESVLRLGPRVAAFDCDGTLWSGDAGVSFFDWEIETGVVPAEIRTTMRARYAEYKDFDGVSFPSRIEIFRPQEEYDITLNMLKVEINQQLKDEQFVLEQPPGAVVEHLDRPHSSLVVPLGQKQ